MLRRELILRGWRCRINDNDKTAASDHFDYLKETIAIGYISTVVDTIQLLLHVDPMHEICTLALVSVTNICLNTVKCSDD